jgi:hypothetical protein
LRFWAAAARTNRSRTNFIRRRRTPRSPMRFLSPANSASTFFRSPLLRAGAIRSL